MCNVHNKYLNYTYYLTYLISSFFYILKHITAIIYVSENKKSNNYFISDKYTQRER